MKCKVSKPKPDALETLKSLLEDAFDDLLLHAALPSEAHDICRATGVHEPEGDVELVAVHPGATDTQDVRVLRERHQLGLLQGAQTSGLGRYNLFSAA